MAPVVVCTVRAGGGALGDKSCRSAQARCRVILRVGMLIHVFADSVRVGSEREREGGRSSEIIVLRSSSIGLTVVEAVKLVLQQVAVRRKPGVR